MQRAVCVGGRGGCAGCLVGRRVHRRERHRGKPEGWAGVDDVSFLESSITGFDEKSCHFPALKHYVINLGKSSKNSETLDRRRRR